MKTDENDRVTKLENTVSVLNMLHNLELSKISALNEIILGLMNYIKATQNMNSQLFQSVVNPEMRQLLSKQQSQLDCESDQQNAAIRDAAIKYNESTVALNKALEFAKPTMIPGLNPIPIINLPEEISGQSNSINPQTQ